MQEADICIVRYEGSYEDFRARLGSELQSEAESFVRIGYMLKVARDTDVLAESGYKTPAEFAAAEYGLTKDVVSRYMAINDRYSEGGYSDRLQERYRVYGYAKLAEMLTLPVGLAEAVPAEATRAEIQALKREVRAEEDVTPMEAAMEEIVDAGREAPGEWPDERLRLLCEMLKEYYRGRPEEYAALHGENARAAGGRISAGRVKELLAPGGNVAMMSRVPGSGRMMLTVREGGSPALLSVRGGERTEYSWDDVAAAVSGLMPGGYLEDDWKKVYGGTLPADEAEAESGRETAGGQTVRITKPGAAERNRTAGAGGGKADGKKDRKAAGKADRKAAGGKEKAAEDGQTDRPGKPRKEGEKEEGKAADGPARQEGGDPYSRTDGPSLLAEMDRLHERAERLLDEVRDALRAARYVSARRAAVELAERLQDLCRAAAKGDVEGQMSMEDLMDMTGGPADEEE